jgi:mannose-6-phosphate isomerase
MAPESTGPDAERRVVKPWGHELIWAHTDRYVGKILVIDAGKRLSLQLHERKDETILVLSGRMYLHLGGPDGVIRATELGPGDHRRIPTGTIHRFEAIERCELIEVSTPELDDVVRLKDDFGREGTSAP